MRGYLGAGNEDDEDDYDYYIERDDIRGNGEIEEEFNMENVR